MSSSIVAYLKMLVTLGTLRHQLAVEYDLPENVRHFVRRLARQQGMALLDPRRSLDRLFAGVGQVQRALELVEFAESMQPVILEATDTLFGFRRRLRNVRRRLVSLGIAVLLVGGILYFVLAYPDDTRQIIPRDMPYPFLHYGLLTILIVLIIVLVANMRSIGDDQ
jgi:hypothetical protein